MPGVTTEISIRPGPASSASDEAATYLIATQAERGPVDRAVLVRSLTELVATFGDRVAYGAGYDDLRMHFEEGGVRAGVVRVVGAAPTLGTRALLAGAAPTLRVDAVDPGGWSARIGVQVTAGDIAGTVTIVVRFDGVIVETFRDLAGSPAAAAALAASIYVRGTDLGGAVPSVAADALLSAGTDDRATIVGAGYVAALERFTDDEFGLAMVAIPGQPAATVGAGLIEHARVHGRVAVLAVAPASTPADAIAAAAGVRAAVNPAGGQYGMLAYPELRIGDGVGVVRTVTPEGYVAAARARAIVEENIGRAPMGEISQARFVLGPARVVDRVTGDALDAAHVSAIRTIAGTTRLYGYRSLSSDVASFRLLKDQDLLNAVRVSGERVLEAYVGRTVDGEGRVLSRIRGDLIGVVEPLAAAGAIFARPDVDPGYAVDTGPSVNPLQLLALNQLRAVMAVRPSPTAELLELNIVRAALTAAV